jgi:hypothetical protein
MSSILALVRLKAGREGERKGGREDWKKKLNAFTCIR